jgi:hypothetical protein
MSILDDAIREHLELKRAHGADDAELKKLEDEAFGPPQRPDDADPFSEAPTEFLGAAEGAAVASPPPETPSGRREPNIADLQEAPPPAPPAEEDQPAEEPVAELETVPEAPAEEEAPEAEVGPTTEERHAIAEQPTEFFDVEAEIESEPAPAEAVAPSDDELADAEQSEPRLASVDQIDAIEIEATEAEAAEEPLLEDEEEEDDFFSEQRLSDELNQALETPAPGEPQAAPRTEEPIPPGPHTEETEAHYAEREQEQGTDEHHYEDAPESSDEADPEEQQTALYDFEATEDEAAETEQDDEGREDDEDEQPPAYEAKSPEHEDVLEDTPSFLEDAPEDDDAWFEQRPPKDFDFDD